MVDEPHTSTPGIPGVHCNVRRIRYVPSAGRERGEYGKRRSALAGQSLASVPDTLLCGIGSNPGSSLLVERIRMFTKERIAELRALCDGATEGPWEHVFNEDESWETVRCADSLVAKVDSEYSFEQDAKDAQFIAAARTALPELLDEVERLKNSPDWLDRELAKGGDVVRAVHITEVENEAELGRLDAENARLRAALVYALKNRGSQFDYDHWIELCTRAGLPMRNGMLDRDALSGGG